MKRTGLACGLLAGLGLIGALLASNVGAATPSAPAAKPQSPLPPDSELQRIVDDRVVTYRDTVGMVIGVVDPTGRRLFVRGPARTGDDESVDGDTVFELGAVTQIFTALLLTDAARRGELSLTDPVAKYLPPDLEPPERKKRQMTLADLATHTSGLPQTVSNVRVVDLNNPNADLTADQLVASIHAHELTQDIGTYQRSDAGYSLLGIAIEDALKTDFATLVHDRLLTPLHMDRTGFADPPDNVAAFYDEHLNPTPRPRRPQLLGASGLRSTANDLLDFLQAELGQVRTPLAPALSDMTKTRRSTDFLEISSAIGWRIVLLHGTEIVWQAGQGPGYRAFLGYSPQLHAGVVVLSNSSNGIEDIGLHILDPQTPLRKLRREIPVNPSEFDALVGRYAVNDNFVLSVTRDGNRLYIQGSGQPRAELFAQDPQRFFLRVVNGEVEFQKDGSGRAHALSLWQNGKTAYALRVE